MSLLSTAIFKLCYHKVHERVKRYLKRLAALLNISGRYDLLFLYAFSNRLCQQEIQMKVEIYLERYTAHSSELVVNCVAIYLMYLHAT